MGFLDRLFGTPQKEQTVVLNEKEALSFMENATLQDFKGLEQAVFSRLAELKHLVKSLESLALGMKEKNLSLEEGNFRLRRAVLTSKDGLSLRLLSLAKKLEPPKTMDLFEIHSFVLASKDLVRLEVEFSRKNIAYTKTILADEMKSIGKILQEIDSVFSSLKEAFSKSKLLAVSGFKQELEKLNAAKNELDAIILESGKLKEELNALFLKKQRLSIDLKELLESSFAAELTGLEEKKKQLFSEKNSLRQKFLFLLQKVDKPLSKFLKMASVDSSLLSPSERELANHYFQNIFIASKKDPKGENIKKILLRVKELVENGTIALKEKEREKKISALKELLEYDFFSEIFWKVNSIEAETVLLEKKISESEISKKISSLERMLLEIQSEIDPIQSDSFRISVKQQQKQKFFAGSKEAVEWLAFGICGKKIVLKQEY